MVLAFRGAESISTLLVTGAVAAALGVAIGRPWGGLHGLAWRWVHGPDRTVRASTLVAVGIGAEAVLLAVLAFHVSGGPLIPIGVLAGAVGASSALLEWVPTPDAAPEPPPGTTELHDGLVFSLPSRPAGVSALLTVLAVAAPLPMAAVALWWGRRSTSTRVRVRGDEVEIARGGRRTVVPLLFAPIEEATQWDGTPAIRVGEAEIPIGGGRPAEVAWAVARLVTATIEADPMGTPAPPRDLTRLLGR